MIKILIVDDHVVVREGVKGIFDEQPGEAAFGEANTAQEALKLVREEKWDAVVLDISLGGRSGLDVLKGNCSATTNCSERHIKDNI
jgi:two-component system, NarL family, invasion response regulator UvrY